MAIQNSILQILASGTIGAGLYNRSPAGQLQHDIRATEQKFKGSEEKENELWTKGAGEGVDVPQITRQATEQAYAMSEEYYNLGQRTTGRKQERLLEKSRQATERAMYGVEYLTNQQRQLALSRAAVLGDKQFDAYVSAIQHIKSKVEEEEEKK